MLLTVPKLVGAYVGCLCLTFLRFLVDVFDGSSHTLGMVQGINNGKSGKVSALAASEILENAS